MYLVHKRTYRLNDHLSFPLILKKKCYISSTVDPMPALQIDIKLPLLNLRVSSTPTIIGSSIRQLLDVLIMSVSLGEGVDKVTWIKYY